MEWWNMAALIVWCCFALILGLVVGSFLNVLIARLPYEKSILWPGSHCLHCYQPIRRWDNVPVLGYLRLRGRCRFCGAAFSSRYLWVELGTGCAFLLLFVLEVLVNWYDIPQLRVDLRHGVSALPPWPALASFFYHSVLISALIAAAVIDAEHRIIPPLIPYSGLVVGVIGGMCMPWPWPQPPEVIQRLPENIPWIFPEMWGLIPLGVQPWPLWGPLPEWAPAGSWRLGLLNSLVGAFAGSLTVRLIRWLFSAGFGREALGLGDADLLMMAGAFLGWQIAVLSLFVGSITALVMFVVVLLFAPARSDRAVSAAKPADNQPLDSQSLPSRFPSREIPFGPGLALGVVLTWLAWPWLGPRVQFVFFDAVIFGLAAFIICMGMLAAGLLLRRPTMDSSAATTTSPSAKATASDRPSAR
jgi:leader peptidase (prepilin peptidase)/N-methyltransferase